MKHQLAAVILCVALASAQTAEDYRKRIEANPSSSLAHYEFGVFLMGQDNLQAAALEFEAALKGDLLPAGIDNRSHEKLSWIFFSNGDTARAIEESIKVRRPRKVLLPEPNFVPPQPVERIDPEYTNEARVAGLEGAVSVRCEIGEDGSVRRAEVDEPLGLGLDQKALEAARQWRFQPATLDGRPVAHVIEVEIDFQLPAKQSRWHLMNVSFVPEEGITPPVIARPKYPLGTGISVNAIDEGRILGAVGRLASATIAFEVGENGHPKHFTVQGSSEELWGHEAIALVSQWQFRPATKNGDPVPAQCVLELVWGPRTLTSESLRSSRHLQAASVIP